MAEGSPVARKTVLMIAIALVALGTLAIAAAIIFWQVSPSKSLNILFGQVWGATGLLLVFSGVLILTRRQAHQVSRLATASLALAVISVAVMFGSVLRFVSISQDGLAPEVGLFATVPLGALTMASAVRGVMSAKRAPLSARVSVAALVLGALCVALPVWLKLTAPSIFASFYGS